MTKLLSNSEMQEWQRCRRKWYLHTYRRLKTRIDDEAGSATWIGNLVHDALAWYYDPRAKANPVLYAQNVLKQAIEADPVSEDKIRKEGELVVIMLEGYMEWLESEGVDADLQILGSEQMARAKLVDGVDLIAKLDAPVLRESDDARLALEHKTIDNFSRLSLLRIDQQFLTEHLVRFLSLQEEGATAEEAQHACQGILWNGLRKVKRTANATPPFYKREDVTHNIVELRNHWRHVVAIAYDVLRAAERLDAGDDHHNVCPPHPTRDCVWDCDFFKICAMFDDGSAVNAAIEGLYVEADPLERYEGTVRLTDSLVS